MSSIQTTTEYNNRIKRVIFTKEEIDAAIKKAGEDLSAAYEGKPLLLVSILKGAYVFMADLSRAVSIPCEIGFMAAKSYYEGTESSGKVKITLDLSQDISKYHVVIVEDIIDSGKTLNKLSSLFRDRGAHSIRCCTLLDKPERRQVALEADYVGRCIPDKFVVGYGLDYDEKYRGLPYVGILKPSVYEK